MPKAAKRRNKSPNKPPRATNGSSSTETHRKGSWEKEGTFQGLEQQSLQTDVKQAHLHSKGSLLFTNTSQLMCLHLEPFPITRLSGNCPSAIMKKESGPWSVQNQTQQELEPKYYREKEKPVFSPWTFILPPATVFIQQLSEVVLVCLNNTTAST